jgi:hypothetical protein
MSVKAEIIGRVKNIKSKGVFVVHAVSLARDFTCTYDGFLPISEDDAIHAHCLVEQHPTYGQQLRIVQPPFVQMAMDRDSIVRCFVRALRGTGFGDKLGYKIFDSFIEHAGTQAQVPLLLNKLSLRIHQQPNNQDLLSIYKGVISATQLHKLLNWWYKQRFMRRFYLLGLNNKEIETCTSYMERVDHELLYQQCLTNPLTITPLPMDKCNQIIARVGIAVTPEDLRCGQISRKIYEIMLSKAWVGLPTQTVMRLFPDAHHHLEKLKKDYGLVFEMQTAYLSYPYKVEKSIVDCVTSRLEATVSNKVDNPQFTRDMSDDQKEAVTMALNNNISIITGGAGTGKTTVIAEIIHNLENHNIPYMVTSFTGKAVARNREVIKRRSPATMHRLISQASGVPKFKHLIIDECSMVTTETMYQFLKTFPGKYKITLVGDPNQLQPISWGAFFEQLINSGKVPISQLTTNHRYLGGANVTKDGIICNALNIINYTPPVASDDPFDDFFDDEDCTPQGFSFVSTENFSLYEGDLTLVHNIVRLLYQSNIKANELTIVTPFNADLVDLNRACQEIYNDNGKSVTDLTARWVIGDRVMMLENNYEINVMNGEEGNVTQINPDSITVTFSDGSEHNFKLQTYHQNDNDEYVKKELTTRCLIHSYAVTCHRAQGSEWSYVIVYIPKTKNTSFVTRNLVYTAITRARRAVWMVGDISTITAAATQYSARRHDNLSSRLQS